MMMRTCRQSNNSWKWQNGRSSQKNLL